MKKFTAIVLILALCMALFGCKNENSEDGNKAADILTMANEKIKSYHVLESLFAHKYENSLEEAVEAADMIVYAEVTGKGEVHRAEVNFGRIMTTVCYTDTEVKVIECLKGDAEKTLTVKDAGGDVNGTRYYVYGSVPLTEGDKALLFLTDKGYITGPDTKCRFIENVDGTFTVDKGYLEEGSYEKSNFTTADVDADAFIEYVKTFVADKVEAAEAADTVVFGDFLNEKPQASFEWTEYISDKIVYGEVIDKGETDIFDIYGCTYSKEMTSHCFTEVKIKVLNSAKGSEEGEIIIYKEKGSEDEEYVYENLPKVKVGDKVILCLTESGCLSFGEGSIYI